MSSGKKKSPPFDHTDSDTLPNSIALIRHFYLMKKQHFCATFPKFGFRALTATNIDGTQLPHINNLS